LVHDARRWNPQRAPSCAHPDESLTERESQVLEQALTDLSGVRFPEPTVDTVLRHAQPATGHQEDAVLLGGLPIRRHYRLLGSQMVKFY